MKRLTYLLPVLVTVAFGSDGPATPAFVEPVVNVAPGAQTSSGVQWEGLAKQSLLFMGIEHGFRLATEPGTRGARGPFLRGYFDSVTRLHGWSDGDPFYVNYIGHPMQGAASGFLWIQNDGERRKIPFSNTRAYWRSRLRAAGYAWAYSTMFEIGPASEASIGFIQSRYPQQGLVDHVVTPSIGLGWMVAEDWIDAKILTRLERHIENSWVRLLARGFFNPSRSMANMLRGETPWHRDTRPGVYVTNWVEAPAQPEVSLPEPDDHGAAPFELTASGERETLVGSGLTCTGGGAMAAFRMSPRWQWIADLNGCAFSGLEGNLSGDSLSYLTGPRWSAAGTRLRPYAQFLIGGRKVTIEQIDPEEKKRVEALTNGKGFTPEQHEEFASRNSNNALALSAATGLDVRLGRAAAVNVASLSYNRSWNQRIAGADANTGVQFSFGVVLRMGNW